MIDGNVYIQIFDPVKASYNVENPIFAITSLCQTAMRSEIGKIPLDRTFEERDYLNDRIVKAIDSATQKWGITCHRYEIKDIVPPDVIATAMNRQANAERVKREQILESEGVRQRAINEAEGRKTAAILDSEGVKQEQINLALAKAQTILTQAEATAEGIRRIAAAYNSPGGSQAASLLLAEQYIKEFGKIASQSNTIVLNEDMSNVGNFLAKALSMTNFINKPKEAKETPTRDTPKEAQEYEKE